MAIKRGHKGRQPLRQRSDRQSNYASGSDQARVGLNVRAYGTWSFKAAHCAIKSGISWAFAGS